MSFAHRATLLSVLLASCCVLPTTFSSSRREKTKSHGYNAESELVDLLSELRERLHNRKETVKTSYRTLYDNENEERWHTPDEVKSHSDNKNERISFSDMPTSALTAEQQQQIVDAINDRRRRVGASDMYKIHWNSNLGKLAQTWSNDCQFNHGNPVFEASVVGFNTVGGNLWASEGPFDADKIVDSWYNDNVNFSADTQSCVLDKVCGPYKQLVTAFTTDVGCGLSTCPSLSGLSNAHFVVCYFAPPGNYHKERTFTTGAPCTACKYGQFYCNNNLCDKTCTSAGANCECKANCHCGTPTSDCQCTCPAGSAGVNCGKPCDDDDDCKGKKATWKAAHCNENFPFVFEICPRLCKKCTPGDPCPSKPEQGLS